MNNPKGVLRIQDNIPTSAPRTNLENRVNHEMLPVRDVSACNPGSATCPLQPIGVRLRLCRWWVGSFACSHWKRLRLVAGAGRHHLGIHSYLVRDINTIFLACRGQGHHLVSRRQGSLLLVLQLPAISYEIGSGARLRYSQGHPIWVSS